jgi:hypothetical protein
MFDRSQTNIHEQIAPDGILSEGTVVFQCLSNLAERH